MMSTPPSREQVLATQRKRWEFLLYLYGIAENTPAGVIRSVSGFDVGKAIGITDRAETERVFSYLKDAELITYDSMGPQVRITRHGVDVVEEAIASPDDKTEHFLPISVINISGGMHGSQIQQGTAQSSQTVVSYSGSFTDWEALLPILRELRRAAASLPEVEQRSALADIEAVEAQLRSPNPRVQFARECLSTLRRVFENTAGGVAARNLGE